MESGVTLKDLAILKPKVDDAMSVSSYGNEEPSQTVTSGGGGGGGGGPGNSEKQVPKNRRTDTGLDSLNESEVRRMGTTDSGVGGVSGAGGGDSANRAGFNKTMNSDLAVLSATSSMVYIYVCVCVCVFCFFKKKGQFTCVCMYVIYVCTCVRMLHGRLKQCNILNSVLSLLCGFLLSKYNTFFYA